MSRSGFKTVPLPLVSRLEEFPAAAIERSGPLEAIRYRGQILPLIRVVQYVAGLRQFSNDPNRPLQVVVYTEEGRSVGLVVENILDIVEESISGKRHALGNGIFGSIVIQDKVTDLIDVQSIIREADPTFYRKGSPAAHAA